MGGEYEATDPTTGRTVTFEWNGDSDPTDDDVLEVFSSIKKPSGATRSFDVDTMAEIRTNLDKTYREIVPQIPPRELARTGVEALGMTAGAAGGAFVPVPGASLVGAGLGYAAAKRAAKWAMDEPVDTSWQGIGKDTLIGAALQGGANLIGKIPGINRIFSPKEASIGPESTFGSEALDKMAYTTMEKAMKVPPSVKQPIRETAINTALEEGIPVSKMASKRVKGILSGLEDDMEIAVANSVNKGNLVQLKDVLTPVQELKDWVSQTVSGKKLIGKIDDIITGFIDDFGPTVTVEQAQTIKQNTGRLLSKTYGELQGVETEATKQIVRGLKDKIAAEIPELVDVNLKYSHLKILDNALERAVHRTGNWDWVQLMPALAGSIVGGATGSIMKASEAVAAYRILRSPYVQSRLAIALKRMGAGSEANVIANTVTQAVYDKLTGKYQQQQDIR